MGCSGHLTLCPSRGSIRDQQFKKSCWNSLRIPASASSWPPLLPNQLWFIPLAQKVGQHPGPGHTAAQLAFLRHAL